MERRETKALIPELSITVCTVCGRGCPHWTGA